jgi:glutamate dehydrogenase/leucine dehydrogenase
MQTDNQHKMRSRVTMVPNGKIIHLDPKNSEDLQFAREAYGFSAEEKGWFRERDRLFVFAGALGLNSAGIKLRGAAPPGILDVPMPPRPDGPLAQRFLTMEDGTVMRWIRHPSVLPKSSRPHWRNHMALFEQKGRDPDFVCYTSIPSFAVVDGADGKFRFLGPGGIRWIDYPSRAAAISDAMDMSLAVAMKIQVVQTPSGGNKISVYGDQRHKPKVLRSIFAAYERMGFIVTSADLGLSLKDLEKYALPAAPTSLVPMGVYQNGIPSAVVTADACLPGLQAMAASLPNSPLLGNLTVSLQGIGEVGFRLAQHLIEHGTRIIIAEPDAKVRSRLKRECKKAFSSGQALFLKKPDDIYDTAADIFCPCALRDILNHRNLARLSNAGVRIIGGPANNLFPDQINGPWLYHNAGLPVVPYEGIGAGGVTGVAYSVMTGIFGKSPFKISDKIKLIQDYVAKVLRWSRRYDLPPQVISDRILFRSTRRRRLLGQRQTDQLLDKLRLAFNGDNRNFERDLVNEYTKKGFFYGTGRYRRVEN